MRVPLLCYFKHCASFRSHQWIQTRVTLWKRSIRAKISDFFVLCNLEIWQMILKNNRAILLCYFKLCASLSSHRCIQIGITVLTFVTLAFDLWPWPFAWTFINGNNFIKISWWYDDKNICEKGVTDRQTSLNMKKPTTWCKSGWVSLVSSSCLYKTQRGRLHFIKHVFIKHAVAVAAYRSCRLWRWEKMSWIHDMLCDHYGTQCWHPIINAGHIAQIWILEDSWQPPISCRQNVR